LVALRLRRLRSLRRMRLARLRRLRRLRRLLLVLGTLPPLLGRESRSDRIDRDTSCQGRVLFDPACSAFLAALAAGTADNVDKRRRALEHDPEKWKPVFG
jgi:hypothetical protein